MRLDKWTLAALCLLLCIAGLLLIFLLSHSQEANSVLASKFAQDGTQADFSGTISKVTQREGGCTISVCDLQYTESCISVSLSEKTFPCALLEKGNTVHVQGTVKSAQYSRFIDANEISLVVP